MAQHDYALQLRDYSNELSSTKIYVPAMTALTIASILLQISGYRTAVDNLTLGTVSADVLTLDRTVYSAATPSNVFAQREMKWLVHYHANTSNKKFTFEIPTADPTGRLVAGTDRMLLTETNAAAWKTSFEALAVSPDDDTDQCTIDYVELVGRDL